MKPLGSEADFQACITELADLCGWWWMHIGDSRKQVRDRFGNYEMVGDDSTAGWPDLVLYHPKRGIHFVEVKNVKDDRKWQRCTNEQLATLTALHEAGGNVDVWGPDDWFYIERFLKAGLE